jgi:hypothetical protein
MILIESILTCSTRDRHVGISEQAAMPNQTIVITWMPLVLLPAVVLEMVVMSQILSAICKKGNGERIFVISEQ